MVKGSGFVCLQYSFSSAVTDATFAMGRKRSSGAMHAGEYIHFDDVNEQAATEPVVHKPGTSNAEIKKMQTMLNRTACKIADTGPGSPGNETNYFGTKTKTPSSASKKKSASNQTGTFDPPTRYALFGIPQGQGKHPRRPNHHQPHRPPSKQKLIGLLQKLRTKLTNAASEEE